LRLRAESVTGKGESDPFHDNNLPEGRFYNRTVQIEATPRQARGSRFTSPRQTRCPLLLHFLGLCTKGPTASAGLRLRRVRVQSGVLMKDHTAACSFPQDARLGSGNNPNDTLVFFSKVMYIHNVCFFILERKS
jgi:hypothetical protein